MTTNIKKILIDPRSRINYSSFYIEGLSNLLGAKKVEFKCISELTGEVFSGMALRIITDDTEKRLYFDFWDGDSINEEIYNWSDTYGKVNLRYDDMNRDKILALGPNFGISLWNPITTIIKAIQNYRIIKRGRGAEFKQPFISFIRDYAYMFIRREKYPFYHHFTNEEQKGYIFSLSTLWWGDLSESTTNIYRGDFMRLCKQQMDIFEGGFYYVNQAEKERANYSHYLQEYKDMIYQKRLSMTEYDKRNRKSLFVFSTPSVNGCLGWKLGEFLCAGKAIISTPLNHVMPGSFENGVHYIEVTNTQEMKDAIIELKDNDQLVTMLKQNAFDYFNKWISPEASVKRVFAKAGIII